MKRKDQDKLDEQLETKRNKKKDEKEEEEKKPHVMEVTMGETYEASLFCCALKVGHFIFGNLPTNYCVHNHNCILTWYTSNMSLQ